MDSAVPAISNRGLIDHLSDEYRVIAPDQPEFWLLGRTDVKSFGYTFDQLIEVMSGLLVIKLVMTSLNFGLALLRGLPVIAEWQQCSRVGKLTGISLACLMPFCRLAGFLAETSAPGR